MKKNSWPHRVRVILASLSLILSIAAFALAEGALTVWLFLQLGPAVERIFNFTSSTTLVLFVTLAIVTITLLFTFIFGRFYCSVLCPLGILQDAACACSPWKNKAVTGNYKKTRYFIAGLVLFFLIAASALPFSLVDPYSNFGRIISGPLSLILDREFDFSQILLFSALPFVILLALVFWKKRVFCTAICPVGTLLGLVAKKAVFAPRLNKDACITCGLCTKACPAGCIDLKNKTIDSERCLSCLKCLSVCPKKAISFARKPKTTEPKSPSGRRSFLFGSLAGIAAFGTALAARFFLKKGPSSANSEKPLPPGAGSPERFASKCTNCNLCVLKCPAKVLRPKSAQTALVHLDFKKGECVFECNKCLSICPTGALTRMKLATKKRWRIGLAELSLPLCITITEKTDCGACAEVCPTGALFMREVDGKRVPSFRPRFCIGCGACTRVCPASPKAVTVSGVPLQTLADDPSDYLIRPKKDNSSNEDWLI